MWRKLTRRTRSRAGKGTEAMGFETRPFNANLELSKRAKCGCRMGSRTYLLFLLVLVRHILVCHHLPTFLNFIFQIIFYCDLQFSHFSDTCSFFLCSFSYLSLQCLFIQFLLPVICYTNKSDAVSLCTQTKKI